MTKEAQRTARAVTYAATRSARFLWVCFREALAGTAISTCDLTTTDTGQLRTSGFRDVVDRLGIIGHSEARCDVEKRGLVPPIGLSPVGRQKIADQALEVAAADIANEGAAQAALAVVGEERWDLTLPTRNQIGDEILGMVRLQDGTPLRVTGLGAKNTSHPRCAPFGRVIERHRQKIDAPAAGFARQL